MAGLLRRITSTRHSQCHPVQDVSALLKPLTLVDAKGVWSDGLWALEHVIEADSSRLTARDTTLLATANAAAMLHPYTSPRLIPTLTASKSTAAICRSDQPSVRKTAPLVLLEHRTPVNVRAQLDSEASTGLLVLPWVTSETHGEWW
jgi:hypothetical protein